MSRLGRALEDRLALRAPLRHALRRLFPGSWSFLLGEVTLFSFVALLLSGVYLALFYRPSLAPVVYHGGADAFAGATLPDAFASVLALSVEVPFGLVVRRFHHFAAHLFIASLLLHAARVYFTGAFKRPRELTWWIGLALFAVALINGFTGYCLPFDMRGGSALRMMMTTLESVPWIGGWLATLAFGAPFPGHAILGRLYIAHVFIGPALLVIFIAAHLYLVVRLTTRITRGSAAAIARRSARACGPIRRRARPRSCLSYSARSRSCRPSFPSRRFRSTARFSR
jgi:ubiquinol-cytochrome c reductase cytochrome b subunit